ncbi:MAG: bifunctional diguanylate cyclase/phosphodiesterase [Bacillota bacterium]
MEDASNQTLNMDRMSEMISDFYVNPEPRPSVVKLLQDITDFFGMARGISVVYKQELNEYVVMTECFPNETAIDYRTILGLQPEQFSNTFDNESDQNRDNFLTVCGEQKFVWTDDYAKIKDVVRAVGFQTTREDDITECYFFAMQQPNLFTYVAFERYDERRLTQHELHAMTALCRIMNAKIERLEYTKKYNYDLLMKDTVIKNENIPIAVVDKETSKVLYHNELYHNVLPEIKVGEVCCKLLLNCKRSDGSVIEEDVLISSADSDQQWLKKTISFKLSNGKDAYMVYAKNNEDYINQLMARDKLTGALLSRGFEEFYKVYVTKSSRNYALCVLDIDKFKYLNTVLGYKIGDAVLKKIAEVLTGFTSEKESFCRLSDDKFALFMRYKDEEVLYAKVRELSTLFDEMKETHFSEAKITIIGGVTLVDKTLPFNVIKDQATTARKMGKGSLKNKFTYYDRELDLKLQKEISIEERIPQAVENDEFTVYLQPKFDLQTKEICGAEALVRWVTSQGMIFPDQFIPLFEKNGFILTLDFIVYEKVMAYIRSCLDQGFPVYPISVNVSRMHIKDPTFLEKFVGLMTKYNVSQKYLELEVTESLFVENRNELKDFIDTIKKESLKVSIDDFGTAYSSLQTLTDIDIDILKIDKGFLDNIKPSKVEDEITKDEILIKNIINLAKELDFNVICEGVETDEQIELLKKVGCELGQGYVFAKPMPIEEYQSKFIGNIPCDAQKK